MAAIAKVCEYSGEYGSYDMYDYKKNNIQIMPKYRKLFKNAEHKIVITIKEKRVKYKNYLGIKSDSRYTDFLNEVAFFKEHGFDEIRKYKIYYKYKFTLIVNDDKLQGDVGGCYGNYTTELGKTKRKLKRLLGTSKLNIVKDD